jgi:3-oxoadipate enol-lactonase
VIVLNDWLCDTSTWDGARPYLDGRDFSWAFTDLRGYGASRQILGRYELQEAALDVLEVADFLGWERFAIVGHSMSTLVAMYLAQEQPDSVTQAVLVTPVPPRGMGADDQMLAYLDAVALGDDATRAARMAPMWGERLGTGWMEYKLARWRETAEPRAVAAYARMYAKHGLPEPDKKITMPLLAVTGELDAPHMREASVKEFLAPLSDKLDVVPIAMSGHYPMQETPPLLCAILQRFLRANAAVPTSPEAT